jgi:hypothetical protein
MYCSSEPSFLPEHCTRPLFNQDLLTPSITIKHEPSEDQETLSLKREPGDTHLLQQPGHVVRTRAVKGPDSLDVIHIFSFSSEASADEAIDGGFTDFVWCVLWMGFGLPLGLD